MKLRRFTGSGLCPQCCVGYLYVSPVVPGELLCTHCRQVAGSFDLSPMVLGDDFVAGVVVSTNPQPLVEGWVNP